MIEKASVIRIIVLTDVSRYRYSSRSSVSSLGLQLTRIPSHQEQDYIE